MVHVLADHTFSPAGTPTYEAADGLARRPAFGRTDSSQMTREEHAQHMRELDTKRNMMRAPRRGWSLTDYQGDYSAPSDHHHQDSIPEEDAPPTNIEHQHQHQHQHQHHLQIPNAPVEEQQQTTLTRRPKLPPPRRSYSVMDYEPPRPGQPLPSKNFTLLDLPSELHYTIFDFLDPIDSVCFGLTHSNFYDIHRRLHGKVPLSSRYSGPNDMEWAWRGARHPVHPQAREENKDNAQEQMRVKGQVYCRKCGISRCELHRHLKDWMGPGSEYCSIKEIYGHPAGEDAKPYCYMKSPKNPRRCGRHGWKKEVALQ